MFSRPGGAQHFPKQIKAWPAACETGFENRVVPGDDVSARRVHHDVGLYSDADKLAPVGEAVMLGTNASSAASSQSEAERLAGAAAGWLTDDFPRCA